MNRRKRAVSLLAGFLALVLVLGLFVGVLPQAVGAASLSDLKDQLNELKDQKKEIDKEIKGLKGQLNDNLKDMKDIVKQKNTIDQEIFKLYQWRIYLLRKW